MENVIEFLEKRGFIANTTNKEFKKVAEKPFKAYIGFDPTADSLHIGNLVGIIALAWLEKFGHTPIVLLGGGTGKIGDPSGKNHERPLLNKTTLAKNIEGIRLQLEKYLQKPLILNNDDWLDSFPLIDFLRDVGKHFRLGPMLGKESVRSRFESEEGMSFTEFSYQLLQGYDFYHLYDKEGVIAQIGGSDQWGNITAGTEFIRKLTGQSAYGLTFPLLTKSDGTKFGKSEQGAVWLDPQKTSPYQFYQYFISIADADVIQLLRMLTFIDLKEIEEYAQSIKSGTFKPNIAQKRLAEELTRFVHGQEGLNTALSITKAVAPGSKGTLEIEVLEEIAKDMPSIEIALNALLNQKYIDIATRLGLFSSKGQGVRLINNGGAYINNKQVIDQKFLIEANHIIGGKYILFGFGKKKKILLRIKKELA